MKSGSGSPELVLHSFNNIFIACYFGIRNICMTNFTKTLCLNDGY